MHFVYLRIIRERKASLDDFFVHTMKNISILNSLLVVSVFVWRNRVVSIIKCTDVFNAHACFFAFIQVSSFIRILYQISLD